MLKLQGEDYLPDVPDGAVITETLTVIHYIDPEDNEPSYGIRWTGPGTLSAKLGIVELAKLDMISEYRGWGE